MSTPFGKVDSGRSELSGASGAAVVVGSSVVVVPPVIRILVAFGHFMRLIIKTT